MDSANHAGTELGSAKMRSARVSGVPFQVPAGQPQSMARYVCELVARNPDGRYRETDRWGNSHTSTFSELLNKARHLASLLRTRKSDATGQVVICFESVLDFVAAAWACLICDIDFVPWPAPYLHRSTEDYIKRTRELSRALDTPLMLADENICRVFRDEYQCWPERQLVEIGRDVSATMGPVDLAKERLDGGSRFLIPTSGTTGMPKLAVIGGRSAINRFYDGLSPDHRVSLYCLDHNTVAGLRMLLPLGRCVSYLSPLRLVADPRAWFLAVERDAVTDVGMSNTIAAILNETVEKCSISFSMASLERIAVGAETIVPSILRELVSNLSRLGMGNATVSMVYSMTETGPLYHSSLPVPALLKTITSDTRRLGLDNCADSWHLRIVDDDDSLLDEGETGRIQVQSDSKLFSGYFKDPEVNKASFTADGWFKTGDLGRLDNGRLTLMGREKTTIIVNARKISCEEVEDLLRGMTGVPLQTVVAAAYRNEQSATDELAVFFVPFSFDAKSLPEIAQRMSREISKQIGVSLHHLVAVRKQDIERTANLKVKRDAMVERYRNGAWSNLIARRGRGAKRVLSKIEQDVLKIWRDALNLPSTPTTDADLFELGGDSLAAIRLIYGLESTFGVAVSIYTFFQNPTIDYTLELVRGSSSTAGHTGHK